MNRSEATMVWQKGKTLVQCPGTLNLNGVTGSWSSSLRWLAGYRCICWAWWDCSTALMNSYGEAV